ncbi:threonine-phosphate decarboxylase CobD [Microvirga sp. WGZ8]|uniref:8-amino-7-oxononanoate synthase n=2 Tax=Microvirga puerhi TaxID=2876078 RepID=A0ABS7VQ72_9HYPH|nr:threonine-phosphate decarboxylase CobD [Microvirga puerhi]MBZ6077260.1 threonine-phosphate decarboxylase CobD [Microvirga puerhi]
MEHGGNLHDAKARFPKAPEPWIDLSTGINPRAYPVPPLDPEIFHRLPSPQQVRACERIAAQAYGVGDPECLVAAAGSQALIGLLPRLRPPGRVAIIGPTYSEHELSWSRHGHRVLSMADLDAALAAQADVIVVVNPNNPDGRVIPSQRLADAAQLLATRGGWLVIDEAFADLEPGHSVAGGSLANTIVLRSVGKAYGLAGLRLGFAVAWPAQAQAIRDNLGPWAVSGPALALGSQALADQAWLSAERSRLSRASHRLDALLHRAGFELIGGTCLFRLARHEVAAQYFERLAGCGIWVRSFAFDPALLRFGIPKEEEWNRLEKAISD